ncbi:hypothetical protein DL765_005528 [Monosporascus sp. GIB2]|nr:hypothetical protein DL765_005528 [Monosporascus sp. GIB2]
MDAPDLNGLFLLNSEQFRNVTEAGKARCSIDLVAIHGVTGNAFTTWTHRNGKLWLRDFLPEALPGIRVFTYGYPSAAVTSARLDELSMMADELLYHLTLERGSDSADGSTRKYQFRPIVLVCHSVGGIIAKQLVVTTVSRIETYSNVHDSLQGIFFLGTPHRASPMNDFAQILSNVAEIVLAEPSEALGRASEPFKYLREPKSATVLEALSRQFEDQTRYLKIISFVEQNTTPPLKRRAVDDVSGTLDALRETVVEMEGCDHLGLARFGSADEPSYKVILHHLENLTTG